MSRQFDARPVIRTHALADKDIEGSSVGGAARDTPAWWAASLHDMARNVVLGWPIPVLLVALVLASAGILQLEGTAVDFGDGLYKSLLALHGAAISDPQHASPLVRCLTVIDWFGGLVLLGTFVWLVTVSFEHGRAESKRHREPAVGPDLSADSLLVESVQSEVTFSITEDAETA